MNSNEQKKKKDIILGAANLPLKNHKNVFKLADVTAAKSFVKSSDPPIGFKFENSLKRSSQKTPNGPISNVPAQISHTLKIS